MSQTEVSTPSMGPAILFDKSAIQSFGRDALREVNRYFHMVVPPVLLMETLADLSLNPHDLEAGRQKVAEIARKVLPIHSLASPHFQPLCIHNLLGEHIPMNRVPVVAGAKVVTAKDGSRGLFVDIQPENDAVLRWRSGRFNANDLAFAVQWRKAAKEMEIQKTRQELPRSPFRLKSLEKVNRFTDLLTTDQELQESVLHWLLSFLQCEPATHDRICSRWRLDGCRSLRAFAPYAQATTHLLDAYG